MKRVGSTVVIVAAASVLFGGATGVSAQEAAVEATRPATEVRAEPAQPAKGAEAKPGSSQAAPAAAGQDRVEEQKMAPPPKPKVTLHIDVDLTKQKMTVSENGSVAGSWAISSGRSGYRTPTGAFRPQWMAKTWYSRKYDNAPMPNAIFFTGGFALHATYATGMLGSPASHGCVRQSPANAARLFAMVRKHGMDHTKIVVHGSPRDRAPAIAERGGDRPRRYAEGLYGQPVQIVGQRNGRQVYYVQPQKKGFLSGLFGDDQPRYVYAPPRRAANGRPLYVLDADGNRIRVR